MDSMRNLFNQQPAEEPTLLGELGEASTLSWKTRLYGCGICAGLGVLFWVIGSLIVLLNLVMFAVLYTLGVLCMIGATSFIVGPWRQLKSMIEPTRVITTVVFFFFMFLTLFSAFYLQIPALVIVCMLFQIVALIWYILSYIPYARELIWSSTCGGSSPI